MYVDWEGVDTDYYYRKRLVGDKDVSECCGNNDDKADAGRDFADTAHTTKGTSRSYE